MKRFTVKTVPSFQHALPNIAFANLNTNTIAMKQILITMGVSVALSMALNSCAERLAYEPTYAIPLVDGSLTITDVVGARPSEIDTVPEGDRVTFQLIYTDILEPIPYVAIDGAPASGYVLPERNIFLRMTGQTETGVFQFTNPTVEFQFNNTGSATFDLFIENTYTKNVGFNEAGPSFEFDITEMLIGTGWPIPASETITHEVNNQNAVEKNTGAPGALTEVFTPAPKNLYYTPRVRKVSGSGEGNIEVITKVILPMEGFATGTRIQTLPYEITDQDARDAFQDNLEFAIIRLSFNNALPVEAQLTGQIVDTTVVDPITGAPLKLADLPLTGQNGTPLTGNIIIEGAPYTAATGTTTPTSSIVDININDEAIKSAILSGNGILLNYVISTTDYTNSNTVKFYGDQTLDINMGIRFKVAVEQDRQELLDTLGI